MNNSYRLAAATCIGILIGAFGIEITHAQSKAPAYVVAEFEVTDPVGWKAYVDGTRANPSGGTFIVRAAQGTSLAGAVPKTVTIVKFNSLAEAIAFDSSAGYSALKPLRDKSSNWRSYVVEGLQN